MPGPFDFTDTNIQDTYQRVVQTDGTNFYDGTGSAVSIGQTDISALNAHTGSVNAATSSFVLNSQTGSFVTNSQTGSFVTNSQTGSFVTNSQTGSFVVNSQTGSFVLNFQTASFAVTGSDVIFNHITASGHISASGTSVISAQTFQGVGIEATETKTTTLVATDDDQNLISTTANGFTIGQAGYPLTIVSNITASGDISASGIISASSITATGNIHANRFKGDARDLTNVPNDLVWDGVVGDGHLTIVTCTRFGETGFQTEAQNVPTSSIEWTDPTGFFGNLISPVIYSKLHSAAEITTHAALLGTEYIVFSGSNFGMDPTIEAASVKLAKIDLNAISDANGNTTDIALLGAIRNELIKRADSTFNVNELGYNVQDSYLIRSQTGQPHQIGVSNFYSAIPSNTEVFSFHYFTSESNRRGGGQETTQIFDVTTNPNKVYSSLATDLNTTFSSSVEITGSLTLSDTTNLTVGGTFTATTITASGDISASGVATFGTDGERQTHTFFGRIRTVGSEVVIGDGHVTASGNISSSGDITAGALGTGSFDHIITSGQTIEFKDGASKLGTLKMTSAGNATFGDASTGKSKVFMGDLDAKNIFVEHSITASGNISASGAVTASGLLLPQLSTIEWISNAGQAQTIKGTDNYIQIDGDNRVLISADVDISLTSPSLNTSGHITASGNISSSGGFIGDLTGTAASASTAATASAANKILAYATSPNSDLPLAVLGGGASFDYSTILYTGPTFNPSTNALASVTNITATGTVTANTATFTSTTPTYVTSDGQFTGDMLTHASHYSGDNSNHVRGQVYQFNGLTTFRARANVASGSKMLGLATKTGQASMLVRGYFCSTEVFNNLTGGSAQDGDVLYMSTTTGRCTVTPTSGSGEVVRVVGYVIDASGKTGYFDPDKTWIET